MTTLILELPVDVYNQLREMAKTAGKSVETLAQEWLVERAKPTPAKTDRERAREVLKAAGLLAELGPESKKLAESSTATLEEVQKMLSQAGGPSLSELIIEQRGPKI